MNIIVSQIYYNNIMQSVVCMMNRTHFKKKKIEIEEKFIVWLLISIDIQLKIADDC